MGDSAYAFKYRAYIILNYISEENYDEWYDDDAECLAGFMTIRTALASGDFRALYLGWLLSVQNREIPDDELEPTVPPGMGQLDVSLEGFARFLNINEDLIHVAAQASPELKHVQPSRKEIRNWVSGLPAREKDHMLTRIIADRDIAPATALQQRFLVYHRNQLEPTHQTARENRTVSELLAAAEGCTRRRMQAEDRKRAEAKKRRERQAAQVRAKYLDNLKPRQAKVWKQISNLIATKQPKRYDQAVDLLIDLRDLAQREGRNKPFHKKLMVLRENHSRKPSFLARLDKADLERS